MTEAVLSAARWRIGLSALLILLVLTTFGRSVGHAFLEGDDQEMVLHQPAIVSPTPERIARLWTQPTLGLYTPLAYTLWAGVGTIVHQVDTATPLDPRVFHGVNVLLHAAVAVIVFDLLRRLLLTTAAVNGRAIDPCAFAGAALFALHPLQTEAVAWVAGMNNLLAGGLVLAAIDAHVLAVTHRKRRWEILAAMLLMAALFSKPTAIVAPLIVVAIDVGLIRRQWRRVLPAAATSIAIALPFVLAGRAAQPSTFLFAPPLPQRLLVVGDTLGFYAAKLVAPWPLLANYDRSPQKVIAAGGDARYWIALGIAAGVLGAAARLARQDSISGRGVATGLIVALSGVSIVSGIVPFAFQQYSTVADRYVYLAMLGPAIAAAFVVAHGLNHARAATMVATVASVLLLAGVSWRQTGWWATTESVWSLALHYDPGNAMALNALGNHDRAVGNVASAEARYRLALQAAPADGTVYFNLGNVLLDRDPRQAIENYQQAIACHYAGANVRNNLAVALARMGQLGAASDVCRDVLANDPENVNALVTLANILALGGDGPGALQRFREAARLDPTSASAADGVRQLESLLK